jgi:hypothetical protein
VEPRRVGPITKLRRRLRAAAVLRVQSWSAGPEMVYPGDPRRRLVIDPTSTCDARLVQFGTDDGFPVTVGKYSGVHHSVTIFHGGIHRTDFVGLLHVRKENDEWFFPPDTLQSKGSVVIGSDVWVTYGAVIMSGVTIGDGAVIGACSVITRSVEPYEIVAGNPARHVKWRFDEETRAALLRIRWWDWPEEKVRRLRHEIDSDDVQGFIHRHDPAFANLDGAVAPVDYSGGSPDTA